MTRQTSKICAFCGECHRLTKEDFWPSWARKYCSIPPNTGFTGHAVSLNKPLEGGRFDQRVSLGCLTRHGHPFDQTLRIVCAECNNGWMSGLQEKAKPHLLPHLLGEWPEKDETAQRALSAWMCMTTLVLERAHPPTAYNTPEERLNFRSRMEPAGDWQIWVGHVEGTKWIGTFNHVCLFGRIHGKSTDASQPNVAVGQWTALAMGNLFLIGANGLYHYAGLSDLAAGGLMRIWPAPESIAPPAVTLTDEQADLLSRSLSPPESRPMIRPAWIVPGVYP